ncbi:unnamed protein product, partial [Somion occarium]
FTVSNHSIWLTFLTSILLLARVAFGLATSALTYVVGTWPAFRAEKGPLFTLSCRLALSAAVDLAIALILIFYLKHGQTGFNSTDNVIRSLMVYAVNTGAITMIVSLAVVLTFIFLKESLLFAGLVTMAIYANSFLGTLNTRQILRKKTAMASTYNGVAELSNFQHSVVPTQLVSAGKQRHIQIFQETTKVTDAQAYSPRSLTEQERRSSLKFDMSEV